MPALTKIIEALTNLREIVKDRQSVTAKRIALTAEFLSDLPEEAVLAAIAYAAKSLVWFPAPAEIRKLVIDPETKSISSAARIVQAIRSIGSWGDPRRMLSPLEMEAIDAVGGWRTLCTMQEDQLPFVMNQLRKVSSVQLARSEVDKQLSGGRTVAGLLEEWDLDRADGEEEAPL